MGLLYGQTISAGKSSAPLRFGRDTVIVWTTHNLEHTSDFVVRIALFEPKRFFEWESNTTQGSVLLDAKALQSSRSYHTSKLFNPGVEVKAKGDTSIWISKEVFMDLDVRGSAKIRLDGIESHMNFLRRDRIETKVNQEEIVLPVIVASDGRGGEWWFLDDPENPLFLKHQFRTFTQAVKSITTNRKNTLRWIKESKIRMITWAEE
jgi:hypothetical protein